MMAMSKMEERADAWVCRTTLMTSTQAQHMLIWLNAYIDGHRLQGSRMSAGLWEQARELAYIYATTNH